MTDATTKRRYLSITARPSPDEKKRFCELAAAHGLSESKLAALAIRTFLELSGRRPPVLEKVVSNEPATDRITIRLRPATGRLSGGVLPIGAPAPPLTSRPS